MNDTGHTDFTVYDTATGEVLRSGRCAVRDVALQTGGKAGLGVLSGVRACDIRDKVIMPAKGKHYTRRRAASEIAQREPKVAGPETLVDGHEVLLEALRAKGLNLSQADLDAAAGAVQARRKGVESAGKQG